MVYARGKIEDGIKTWKRRRNEWPSKILMTGISGLVGSLLSSITQMQNINFLDMKLGTYLVILGWVIGTPSSWGIMILISNHLQRKNAAKLSELVAPMEIEKKEKKVNESIGTHTSSHKMTAFWLIILTIIGCSSIPALMIWLTSSP